MPEDTIKFRGQTKASKPDAGSIGTYSVPVFGVVKDNIDPNRSGRIKVFISQVGSKDPDSSDNWVTVSHLSTFFGVVRPTAGQTGYGTYKENPSSYGQWQAPPDIGTKVVCIFINGDPNYGFYIGAVQEAEVLQMVPAIGSFDTVILNEAEAKSYGGATRLPVTNMNTNDKKKVDSNSYNDTPKPVHSYTAAIMSQQGVIRDPIRGPISTSASRETASRVGWGVSSPGRPIYEGGYDDKTITQNLDPSKGQELRVVSRRGGHSIIMDDGDIIGRDQLIRIRTALGHQITMSDDGQTLMILHSNGQSYIELGKEGTIDMYSTNSYNVRSQGDINFHADQDINFNAVEKMNFQAKNLTVNVDEEYKTRVGKNRLAYVLGDDLTKIDGGSATAVEGEASLVATGNTVIKGKKINLNTASASKTPEKIDEIKPYAQDDTLFDKETGFSNAPAKLATIVTRAPAHAPWSKAGLGVDVKTNQNASSQLPSAPSAAVQQTNEQVVQTGAAPPNIATVASVPSTTPISKAMDAGTTNAVLGAVATGAATGPSATAVSKGAAVLTTLTGASSAVGSFALTPSQLATGGALKPGADYMVNAVAKATGNITQSYPNSVFTGALGINSINALASGVSAQTGVINTIAQKAQTGLTLSGVISGKEAPTQIAGLVASSTVVGLNATKSAIGQLSGVTASSLTSTAGLVAGQVGAQSSTTIKTMASGLSAAGLASSMGGFGGIQNALKSVGMGLLNVAAQLLGPAAAGYMAIKSSFTKLKARTPQNLGQSNKNSATSTAITSSLPSNSTASTVFSNVTKTTASTSALFAKASTIGSTTSTYTGSLNDSIAGITGTKNLAVANTVSTINSINVTAGTGTDVTNLIEKTSGVSTTTQNVSDAVNAVGSMSGSAPTIASGQLNELPGMATVVQSGSAASLSSQVASGVSGVPGGISTFGTVINNGSFSAAPTPGVSAISTLISENQTAVVNGVANNPSLAALTKSGSLNSLVSGGLSVGDASSLSSSISSASGGSAGSAKLPTSAFNTNDRAEITSQIDDLLADPKIPKPNLVGDVKPESSSSSGNLAAKSFDERKALNDRFEKALSNSKAARDAYYKAMETLPQGDPAIEAAKLRYDNASAELDNIRAEVAKG